MKLRNMLMILGAGLLLMASCSPDDHDLAAPDIKSDDLVEGIAFTITHDSSNPNIVYLSSLLPSSYQVAWETPQGRTVSNEYTLKIAFDGDYEVRMGVSTKGGYVWSQPATFHIDEFCTDFVDHFLWNRLSGGIGNSKTWQIDLAQLEDGSAKTTFWKGPHWYFNHNFTWDKLHSKAETETVYANYIDSTPWEASNAIDPTPAEEDAAGNGENWYWAADYAGNSWMCSLANYGYMALDLINGAHVTLTDAAGNVVGKGTYMLDIDNHTISFSDVFPLNTKEIPDRTFRLLYLSETAMQMVPYNSNDAINYVTRNYFENYVPDAAPEPELPDGWRDDVTQSTSTVLTWGISPETPMNWCSLSGSFMNDWKTATDYPDWLGMVDPSVYAGFSLLMNSADNTASLLLPDGTKVSTTFTLDDKGIFMFNDPVPSFTVIGWASFHLDDNNALRIMSIEKDENNRTTGMWLGAKDPQKDEYMAYHLVLK
ncbi:MAG: hypothetical protein J6A00_06930 [Bacteroides sp.]|uniref:hypothetical protein n=1 Tax=Phocaeicola sartorii TaxID=671267 RepID=UPI001B2418DD|nr:hypothetical protein [Phocaeicola sartorii]MBO5507481.1 hypothetical protein [Bacteroides sp.]